GPGFAAGSPVSPMSPYDWFSGAPTTPGVTGVFQYVVDGTYRFGGVSAKASIGIGDVTGSVNNGLYWGEPLIPNLNPHGLSRAIPYAIAFPTHAGQDDAAVFRANVLSGSIGADDDSWRVRGGYFDLMQTDRFVFAPAPLTSVVPSLGPSLAETLGPGMPAIDSWQAGPTALPLLGADAYGKVAKASMEVTDALLPSPSGTSARLAMGSLVFDEGDAGRYSVQLAHVWTGGAPITTTTYYGVDRQTYPGVQGRLFTSVLQNQDETIAGVRAFFHPLHEWDGLAELGRSWYDASPVTLPGTQRFGNFEHFALVRHFGDDSATIEYHRFDPTYATAILPYGIPENVWSVAWSWPGVWLKSNYQMVDNGVTGANRAGYRFRYDGSGKLEAHVSYGQWRQLVPETVSNASQVGFVDGYFLLQRNGFGTYGSDRQAGVYLAWHLPRDDVAFDGVEDYLDRPSLGTQTIDTVAMRTPELVFSVTHHFSKTLLASAGYGRYEAVGTWATTPVQAIYGLGFAGVQFATGPKSALLVQVRRYALTGVPSAPDGLPPTMQGTGLVVDQRIGI
ncbi:MAG TPA: hypothetical protein VKB39_05125, partial [Candidatus Baltobacteraceae bacterium]|nr:hypothetical protein [Candidatus Baltobacteraceae bacterium]